MQASSVQPCCPCKNGTVRGAKTVYGYSEDSNWLSDFCFESDNLYEKEIKGTRLEEPL